MVHGYGYVQPGKSACVNMCTCRVSFWCMTSQTAGRLTALIGGSKRLTRYELLNLSFCPGFHLMFFFRISASVLISTPSLGVYYCQQLTLSVCLVTELQIASFLFLDGI